MLLGYVTIGALNGASAVIGGLPIQQAIIYSGTSTILAGLTDFISGFIYTYLPGGILGALEMGAMNIGKMVLDAFVFAVMETYVDIVPSIGGRTLFMNFIYQLIILMISHGVLDLEQGMGLDF